MRKGLFQLRLGIAALALLFAPFLRFTSCMATQADRDQALQLANSFHDRVSRGEADGIYEDADAQFKEKVNPDHHRALFAAIDRKLGSPMDCDQVETAVRIGFMGRQIRTQCTTRFSKAASATEIFVWRKNDDQYRLYSYIIRSNDLINR